MTSEFKRDSQSTSINHQQQEHSIESGCQKTQHSSVKKLTVDTFIVLAAVKIIWSSKEQEIPSQWMQALINEQGTKNQDNCNA